MLATQRSALAAKLRQETRERARTVDTVELSAFDKNEPSLRDVFLKLVGRSDAAEVAA